MASYRELTREEFDKLIPVLGLRGWRIPYPAVSRIFVAEEEGKIVGFVTAQLVPHAEPIWVDPLHRGQGVAEELALLVDSELEKMGAKSYVAVATNRFAERLCEKNGMKPFEGKIYVKE